MIDLQAKKEWYRNLYGNGLERMTEALPAGDRASFEAQLKLVANPENAKAQSANQSYALDHLNGADKMIETGNWPVVRQHLAKSFGASGDVPDEKLFGMIGEEIKWQQDEETMLGDLVAKVRMDAMKEATPFLDVWEKHAKGMEANPGYFMPNHDNYRAFAEKMFNEVRDQMTPLRPVIDMGMQYYSQAGAGKFNSELRSNFIEMLLQLPDEDRRKALAYASAFAGEKAPKTMAADGTAGPLEKLTASINRGLGNLGRDAMDFMAQKILTEASTKGAAGFTDEEAIKAKRYLDIAAEVDDALQDSVDPVKSKSRIVEGLYDASEMLPYMMSAGSLAGLPVVFAAIAEDSRRQFVAAGIPDVQAERMATVSSVFQTGIERMQALMTFTGKLPGVEAWLSKSVGTKLGLLAKMAGVGTVEMGQQMGEELIQNITPAVVQEIGSWVSDVVTAPDWDRVKAQFKEQSIQTFFAMLPMVLVGTGAASFKEAAYGQKYLSDKTLLQAMGFNAGAAEEISQLSSQGNIEAAQEKIKAGWDDPKVRDPEGSDATKALKQIEEQTGAVPHGATVNRRPDGTFEVIGPDGKLIDIATTPEAVGVLLKSVNERTAQMEQTAMTDLIEYFNQRAETGSTIEVVKGRKYLKDMVAEGQLTEQQAQEAVKIAVELGALAENTKWQDVYAQGENRGVYDAKAQVYSDVSRLFDGADPLVLVEEKGEGYLKRQIALGRKTWADVARWKATVEGTPIDTNQSERALTEWFSSQVKAWIVGNATAEGIPASFKAFLDRVKAYMSSVMRMAANLIELDAAGKLEGDFKAALAGAVGIDQGQAERVVTSQSTAQAKDESTFALKSIISPVRRDQLAKMDRTEMMKRAGSAKFMHLQQVIDDVAQAYGVKILSRQPLIGGWTEKGKTSLEVPEAVIFDTNDVDLAEEMAAIIAASAPELQNSALIWKDDVDGNDAIIEFQAKSTAAAKEIAEELNKGGVKGFSYDPQTRRFTLVLTGLEAVDHPKLNAYLDKKSRQGNLGSGGSVEARAGSARFPTETDYRGYLQNARNRALGLEAGRSEALLDVVSRAERRIARYEAALKISKKAQSALKKLAAPLTSAKAIEEQLAGRQFENIRSLGQYLDSRFKRMIGKPVYDLGSEEGRQQAGLALAYDILDGLTSDGSGMGWYDERVHETIRELEKIHPEFAENPQLMAVYVGVLATTSQGYTVTENFKQAERVYEFYRKNGRLPLDFDFAKASDPINNNLTQIQKLIDEYGLDGYAEFMDEEITGDSLRDMYGFKPTGVKLKDTVRGNRILGPKIGSFFNNLRGRFDTITMDLWYTRTMHRYLGESVVPLDSDKMQKAIAKFRDEIQKQDVRTYDIDIAEALKNDEATVQAALTLFQRWARGDNKYSEKGYQKFKDGYKIEKAARTIFSIGGMKGAPQNKSYRDYFSEVVREAKQILASRGFKLTEADMQAIVWYREKNLFARTGVANAAAKPADYLDAAMVTRRNAEVDIDEEAQAEIDAQEEADITFSLGSINKDYDKNKKVSDYTKDEWDLMAEELYDASDSFAPGGAARMGGIRAYDLQDVVAAFTDFAEIQKDMTPGQAYLAFRRETSASASNLRKLRALLADHNLVDTKSTFALATDAAIKEVKIQMKQRRLSMRVEKNLHPGAAFSPALREAMSKAMYQVIPQADTVEAAMKIISTKTVQEAIDAVHSDVSIPLSVRVALGLGILRQLDATGHYEQAIDMAEKLSLLGTEMGRAVNMFKFLGGTIDTPEKAQVFFARQVERLRTLNETRQPAIGAARKATKGVQARALELLAEWLDQINRPSGKVAKVEKVTDADRPDVTFALTAEQRQSGVVEITAKMLQERGAKATIETLRRWYGVKVDKSLPDILTEAQRTIQLANEQRLENKAKREAKAGKTPAADQKPVKPTGTPAKGLSGPLLDLAVAEVVNQIEEQNLNTPKSVHDAVRSLFEEFGLNATPEAVDEVFKQKFKLPTLTKESAARLAELAVNIASTPDQSAERTDATIALMNFVHEQMKDTDPVDMFWSIWYANVLSGYNTHFRNVYANFLSLGFELPLAALRANPLITVRLLQQMLLGAGAGAKVGAKEGIESMRTGNASILRSEDNKFREGDLVERMNLPGGKINPYNWLKMVKRALTAEDLFAYATAQEAKARMIAYEMAVKTGKKGDALADLVERMLNNTDEQLADFGVRAANEWANLTDELRQSKDKTAWVARRVAELRMQERNGQLIERASSFAARAVFNYKPDGIIGTFANTLMDLMGKASQMSAKNNQQRVMKAIATSPKLVVPFIRIGANVLSRGIDYSGAGILLSQFETKFVGKSWGTEAKTADERAMEMARGVIGLSLMAGIWLISDPEDEEATIQIHGPGTGSRQKDMALHGPNFKPYSIEYRKKDGSRVYYSFQYTPLAIGLGIMGHIHDAQRYGKFTDKELMDRVAFSMMRSGAVVLDQSFMSNAADLMKILSGGTDATEKAFSSFMGRMLNPAALLPFNNLLLSIDRDFDSSKRSNTTILAGLMSNVPVARRNNLPSLDVLGDPIDTRPFDWLVTSTAAGSPEARIYQAFAAKQVSPSDTRTYKSKMEPEMFYEFNKVRGELLKQALLADGEDLLNYLNTLEPGDEAEAFMSALSRDINAMAKEQIGYVAKEE